MRSIEQRQIQTTLKGMQRKGALGFAFDENHGVGPEAGILTKPGNRPIRALDREGRVMCADVRQDNGAAAAASLSGELKGSAFRESFKSRRSHRIPRMKLRCAGNLGPLSVPL